MSVHPRAGQFGVALALAALAAVGGLFVPASASAQATGLGVYQPGVEGQIWQQLSYVGSATCIVDPNTGLCTTPPDTSLGKYYYPIQIVTDVLSATSGRTTGCAADNRIINYVTDQWNNRVQAFDYCGNPVPFPNAPNGWPTIGGGPAGGAMTSYFVNPEGIFVDAAHHIIVADRENSRVAIFNENGSLNTEILVTPGSLPTGVAVSPGTVMGQAGTGFLAVALSSGGMSNLLIYDPLGNLIAQNPTREDCAQLTPNGGLCGPTSITIDSANRIYVADLYNNRIAGFTTDLVAKTLTYRFGFGAPVNPTNPQPSELQSPYSVALDQLGRVIVGDAGNQRLVVFSVSFAAPATLQKPAVQYLFYLDAKGDLNGYPRGIAQDRQGRLYSVDTANFRIQRFAVPSLAVVNPSVSPAGSIPLNSNFTITAAVAVPLQKPAVTNVVPNIVVPANATLVSGPTPVAPTPSVPTPTIGSGQLAYYSWTLTATGSGLASFSIGASGDPNPAGPVTAPAKVIVVTIGCANCPTTPPVTTATVSSTRTSGSWHSLPATVQLVATDAAQGPNAPGVNQIRLHLTGAQGTATLGLPRCAQQFNSNIEYCVNALPGPPQTSLQTTLNLDVDGVTTVWFRAMDNVGNVETEKSVQVAVDGAAPVINFTPAVQPNGLGWYGASTTSVTVTYSVSDSESGLSNTTPATGTFTVAAAGITSRSVTAVDNVGNSQTNSYAVKIDRTPPAITPMPAQTVELTTSAGTPLTLSPAATDALSGIFSVATNAPAVFPLGTTTVTITAVDNAGNTSTATTSVTVRDTTPPVITVSPAPVTLSTTATAGTVAMPSLTGQLVATDLNGPITVTQSPGANTALAPGVYTTTLTATDKAGNKSTTTTAVTVKDLTPPVITSCAPPMTVSLNPTTNQATVPSFTTSVHATDNSGALLSITQAPAAGTVLTALGSIPVALLVADPSGNSSSCSSTLTVLAVPMPTATLVLTPGVLWPPNHKMVTITAAIALGTDPNATVQLVSVTSSEPDNGLGDGDKPIDEQTIGGKPISTVYGTDTRTFKLRAERSGNGPGRVYTVIYRISNAAGSITVSGVVLVPHDM